MPPLSRACRFVFLAAISAFATTGAVSAQAAPAPSTSNPTVSSVTPARATAEGFQPVLVRGTALSGATAVLFGGRAALQVQVRSAHRLIAVAPAGRAGQSVDVRVRTAAGTSARSSADRVTYLAPAELAVRNDPLGGGNAGYVPSVNCPKPGWCASADELGAQRKHPLAFSVVANQTTRLLPIPLPPDGNPQRASIEAVSCSAIQSCVAVGTRDYTLGAMIATLQDGHVTSVPVDGLAGLPRSVLTDTSCTKTVCVAVGGGYDDNARLHYGAVVERNPDGSWTQVTLPRLPVLAHVSCAGQSCVALGDDFDPTVVVRTAAGWQPAEPPVPAGGTAAVLTAVDCYAADRCVASGSFTAADGLQHQLFDSWDGGGWTATAVPRPFTLSGGFAPGPLSCSPGGTCFAAGDAITYFAATGFVARLVHHSASVSVLPVPTNRSPIVLTSGTDLACSSSSFCVLGGSYQVKDPEFGRIFYGATVLSNGVWTYQRSLRSYSASCAPPGFCALGGEDGDGAAVRTFTTRF